MDEAVRRRDIGIGGDIDARPNRLSVLDAVVLVRELGPIKMPHLDGKVIVAAVRICRITKAVDIYRNRRAGDGVQRGSLMGTVLALVTRVFEVTHTDIAPRAFVLAIDAHKS